MALPQGSNPLDHRLASQLPLNPTPVDAHREDGEEDGLAGKLHSRQRMLDAENAGTARDAMADVRVVLESNHLGTKHSCQQLTRLYTQTDRQASIFGVGAGTGTTPVELGAGKCGGEVEAEGGVVREGCLEHSRQQQQLQSHHKHYKHDRHTDRGESRLKRQDVGRGGENKEGKQRGAVPMSPGRYTPTTASKYARLTAS